MIVLNFMTIDMVMLQCVHYNMTKQYAMKLLYVSRIAQYQENNIQHISRKAATKVQVVKEIVRWKSNESEPQQSNISKP